MPAPPHPRSAFTGTLTTQLKTLLNARADARDASAVPKGSKGKKSKGKKSKDDTSLPEPPVKGLDTLVLPESEWQPTRLREAMFVKKTGSFCCSACGSHPVAAMREKADGKWRAFVDAVGGVPRVDRRCLLLGAKLMAVAVGGSPDAVAGVRHLCAAPIWDLAPTSNAEDADDYVRNIKDAVKGAWPKLRAALVAGLGAEAVNSAAKLQSIGDSTSVGMCTLDGYASMCGAVQMNALSVKVPHPLMKYVVSTIAAEGALADHVRWLVDEKEERVAKKSADEDAVLSGAMDIDDIDLDSDSDDDDTREAAGDERYTFAWGSKGEETFEFDTTVFPAFKAAGVFPIASSLNHSCDPNCEVAYVENSDVHILAKRVIKCDEECTIAYVDPELDGETRREELRETYGFDCECDVCIKEGFVPHLKRRKVTPPKVSGGGAVWGELDAEIKKKWGEKGSAKGKAAKAKPAPAEKKKAKTPAKKEKAKTPAKKATPAAKGKAKGGKKTNPVAVSEDDTYDDLPPDFEDEEVAEEEAFSPTDDKKYAKIFGGLDLPEDFSDEEIDEDAAFTAEDKKKFAGIFSPANKKAKTPAKKVATPAKKAKATPAKKSRRSEGEAGGQKAPREEGFRPENPGGEVRGEA